MTWTVAALVLFYCSWLVIMLVAWRKLVRPGQLMSCDTGEPSLYYSVVIPFRNEAENLAALVRSIRQEPFPRHAYEIILVNDHSTDNYCEVVEGLEGVRLLQLTEGQGKKRALNLGILAAKGDVIVTTDADCEVSKNWLGSLCYYFENCGAMFVSGAVTFQPEQDGFQQMQTIEFASLVGVGAASIQLKTPGMCNGANLAFKKEVFHEVGGYEDNDHLPSGDDEFLLHKIATKYPGKVYFNTAPASFVKTQPLDTFKQFVHQRKRWAGKWTYYSDLRNSLLAAFIGISNFSVLIALFYAFNGVHGMWVLIGIKLVLEGLFLNSVLQFVDKSLHLVYFLVLQVIYPFYVVYFAVIANLGGYTWKGRQY
ncbi:MAG: glycosyltransferase [Cytophagales bacterium]|nr:glycosyltransferase [Cytophagales bacterium]